MDHELKLFAEMPQRQRAQFYLIPTWWVKNLVLLFLLNSMSQADPNLATEEFGSLKIAGGTDIGKVCVSSEIMLCFGKEVRCVLPSKSTLHPDTVV
ncbi:UNVERIFIED_CONTAM: hypothetical protein Scaly_1310600 [Sesamum calycinum]|uniref:Uncharacterized protein n=1 Tax=Sesamum calycinum TaxID=2727403 RepID=A0AAW2Q739_9LAMI